MNILIASDIHGSVPFCGKLIKACYEEKVNSVLLLGDILDGNRETAGMLNSLNREKTIICVRGNCDHAEDQAMLEFPIMAYYCLLFIRDRLIFASHGHKAIPNISPDSILLHGHTHIPSWERTKAGYLELNPGSVSKPRQNTKHSYMILTDEAALWKDLEGNIYHELKI